MRQHETFARDYKAKVPRAWQDKRVMKFLRKKYTGKKRATAIAVYQSMTELASNQASEIFLGYYAQLGELAGRSVSSIKRYCQEFIRYGVLAKRTRKKGKTNLANEWTLLAYSPLAFNSDFNREPTDKILVNSKDNNSDSTSGHVVNPPLGKIMSYDR